MKTFSSYINQPYQIDEGILDSSLKMAGQLGGVGTVGRFARGAMKGKTTGEKLRRGLSSVYYSKKPLSNVELAGNIAGSVGRWAVNTLSRFNTGQNVLQSGSEAAGRARAETEQQDSDERIKSRHNIKILQMKKQRIKDLHSRASTPDRKRVLDALLKKTDGEIRMLQNRLIKKAEADLKT